MVRRGDYHKGLFGCTVDINCCHIQPLVMSMNNKNISLY